MARTWLRCSGPDGQTIGHVRRVANVRLAVAVLDRDLHGSALGSSDALHAGRGDGRHCFSRAIYRRRLVSPRT